VSERLDARRSPLTARQSPAPLQLPEAPRRDRNAN